MLLNVTGKLMTLAQAAEKCACSTKTLRRAIDAGALTAYRLGQGAKSDRIHPADLNIWWGKCKVQTCQSPSGPMEAIKLPSDTADERLERLLGTGRTRKQKNTSSGGERRSKQRRPGSNQTDSSQRP